MVKKLVGKEKKKGGRGGAYHFGIFRIITSDWKTKVNA